MPNHWESSARPLFIKTVFVNGSRHAILFEKDPLIRCVNSPNKKTSRPNSSLSFSSGLSNSSSEESQNSECKTFRLGRSQGKDLSSELQSCLVKFKLASNDLRNNKKFVEKCFCDSKKKENSNHKTHKENRKCENFFEENEYKIADIKNSREKSCYIYNLENYKGRKNYSFVKITSQPPQFILNCSCENDWNETQNCNPRNKNNLVISASIQNLVMTPTENENLIEKPLDYVLPFENSELHWNYLTKSYYSSLAERVFQWLDLTKRKRKKPPEELNLTDTCDTGSERICSGEKFAKEIKKNEDLCKSNKNSSNKKNGKNIQSDTSEEEIEEKVVREQNVETLLSLEKIKNNSRDIVGNEIRRPDSLNYLKNSPPSEESNPLIFNIIKTPLKIQDLFVNSPSKETTRDHKEIKDRLNVSPRQNEDKETSHSEGEESDMSLIEGGGITEKSKIKHQRCYCNMNLDKYADDISSQILTEEFADRNQKSINNLNNTRTRPALIQNLSPQQHDKISSLEEEKIVWASEKSTGRPQLHIFMPSVLLKDQSDDSMSECETFFNL